jgi:hypothetical protein
MAITLYEIPLTPTPQKLAIKLAGITYQMTILWNFSSESWMISLGDADGVPIISSIPMVLGANLLEQFDYLQIGGSLIAQVDSDTGIPPNFTNLGTEGRLMFGVDDGSGS